MSINVSTNTNPNIQGVQDTNNLITNTPTGSLSFGTETATFNTLGKSNTYFGNYAAQNTRSGNANTIFGFRVGQDMAGDANVYMGFLTAFRAFGGNSNLVIGSVAGSNMQSGLASVYLGMSADAPSYSNSATGCLGVGAFALSGFLYSSAVGFRSTAIGNSALSLGANTKALGDGSFNIADRIRGFYRSADALSTYSVQLDADALRLNGTAIAFCDSSVVNTAGGSNVGRPRWVASLQRVGQRANASASRTFADLVFRSVNHSVVRFTDDFQPGVFNFTGQHRCVLASSSSSDMMMRPGSVLIATGSFMDLRGCTDLSSERNMDECIPQVELCSTKSDPRVIGVFSRFEDDDQDDDDDHEDDQEDGDYHREYRKFAIGCIQFKVPKEDTSTTTTTRQRRVVINSAGEGGIWVCDRNGPISVGDLLVSSDVPGAAMRQHPRTASSSSTSTHYDNSIPYQAMCVMNTTIAKATSSCDFDEDCSSSQDDKGKEYRHAFIGCVYLTG